MARQRLVERIEHGVAGALTLIAAPAGAGKTAVVTEWLATQHAFDHVAWLSLDRFDRDRRRFWRGILSALSRAGVPDPVASLTLHRGDSIDTLLPTLVNALDELSRPVALVLDDVHEIGHGQALNDLDRLLRDPPPNLRVIIATRVDPPLRLARLRVAGQLMEIGEADLAFTSDEAERLFRSAGVELEAHEVELLWQRTEGWAAGLRLAALRLRADDDPGAFVARFAGDDATVADYLLAEVLGRCAPEIRTFLLRIAVVDVVNAELARALTGQSDADRVLARLDREHALISATLHGGWYRIHPLFAELLRSELLLEAPDEAADLLRRAARWLGAHGRPVAALGNASAAGDWELFGELAVEHWLRLFLEGDLAALQPIAAAIPPSALREDPKLGVIAAAILAESGHASDARSRIAVAAGLADRVPAARRDDFEMHLAAVELMVARALGDVDSAAVHAATLLHRHREEVGGNGSASTALRALVAMQTGIVELWAGRFTVAERHLTDARRAAEAAEVPWLVLVCTANLGVCSLFAGRLEHATGLADEAIRQAELHGWSRTWPVGVAAGIRSAVCLQRNDLSGARRHLEDAERVLAKAYDVPLRVSVNLQRAFVSAAEGHVEPALASLRDAQDDARDWPVMSAFRGLLLAFEGALLAALGDVDTGIALLEDAESETATLESTVSLARLLLLRREAEKARSVLHPWLDGDADAMIVSRVDLWVTDAMISDSLADHEAAARSLERALALAEPGGLHRAFLQHGERLGPVLERQKRYGTSHRSLLEMLLEQLKRPRGGERPRELLLEPLSARELAVLRFLPTMMSNAEIASELFVTVNTVKTHLKAIYRKLDVTGRRDAVRRAREVGLIGGRVDHPQFE